MVSSNLKLSSSYMANFYAKSWTLTAAAAVLLVGLCSAIESSSTSNSGLHERLTHLSSTRIQQCREGCIEKSGFPPYNYKSLPDALHLLCWDECAKPPPPKINKSILETWALRTVSMLQQDSLVLVDVAWLPLNTPNQCLVTWEVSGGGLMGNLLTESSNVQLSLWPDTKYRVQVTCKNKKTGSMSRSLPLTIDTAEATVPKDRKIKKVEASLTSSEQPKILSKASTESHSISALSSSSSISEDQIAANDIFNHHTNFVFNWHNSKNKDDVIIDKIVPVDNHQLISIMTIKGLSEMQKPLVFGVIAGTGLLAVILFIYICLCIVRGEQISSDKRALIDDDGNVPSITVPPSIGAPVNCHFGPDSSTVTTSKTPTSSDCAVSSANYNKNGILFPKQKIIQTRNLVDTTNSFTYSSRNLHTLNV